MKKLLIFAILALICLGVKAADADLVVWDSTTGASKTGCSALVTYATENGIDKPSADADHKRLPFVVFNGKFELYLNRQVTVNANDKFCIRYKGDDDQNDTWLHNHTVSFPSTDWWYDESGDDMKFSTSITFNHVCFEKDGNRYRLTFDIATAPSLPSDFAIEVWALDNGAQKWNTSGGIYAPFNTRYALGRDKDGNVVFQEGAFPLADRYKGSYKQNPDKKLLLFNGPLTADEMAKYGDHAKHFASTDYETAGGFETMGFNKENETELYVIDFREGNNLRGLYVQVPTIADMDRGSLDTDGEALNRTDLFYRMGVRFGFLDRSYALGEKNDGANDHLRYVKWGHVFRLNEVSRPLNAFPTVDTNGKVTGFTDDFGPCEWNGVQPEGNGASDFINVEGNQGLSEYRNKRGDSRILAERNFWLKRIFLEVAYADADKKVKRFYIYFDGEYDLSGTSRTFAQDYFHPVSSDNSNFVTETPNIWHGSNLAADEPAFNRFHNLDINKTVQLLGIDQSEYTTRRGKNHYLYNMDFTSPYKVESTYQALNENNVVMEYLAAGKVKREVSYYGEGGKYYMSSDTEKKNPLDFTTNDEGGRPVVQALQAHLMFDPKVDDYTPRKVHVKSTYTFPNRAFYTESENTYDLDPAHTERTAELTLAAEDLSRGANSEYVQCKLDWSGYQSIRTDWETPNTPFPVANYVVSTAVTTSADTPADDAYQIAKQGFGNPIYLGHENTFWKDNASSLTADNLIVEIPENLRANVKNGGLYIHFKVDAYYNFCFPQNGILKNERLYEDAAMTQPSDLLKKFSNDYARAALDLSATRDLSVTSLTGHSDLKDVTIEYQIRPTKVTGRNYIEVSKDLTGIEGVDADLEQPAVYYNLQGVQVAQPQDGQIYIVRRGDKAAKQVYRQ